MKKILSLMTLTLALGGAVVAQKTAPDKKPLTGAIKNTGKVSEKRLFERENESVALADGVLRR
ncbi:MAG: hypothetical protein M3525_04785, partial [Acidobacteriota bacterium]|nr:hypothetical protein [Acidobacteriota bacterium]